MKSAPRGNHPLLLLPTGPWAWASCWQIAEGTKEFLKTMGVRSVEVSPFSRTELSDELIRASAWIIPYGGIYAGFGQWLTRIRENGTARPPALILTNGEGAKGSVMLTTMAEALQPQDILVAPCSAERRLLEQTFPKSRGRIAQIPLPPPKRFFEAVPRRDAAKFRQELGLRPSDPLLVYAGRLSLNKNVHQLLLAFATLLERQPRAKLHILGAVDQIGAPHLGKSPEFEYSLTLSRMASQLGLDGAVRFVGPVSHERLRQYFASCNLHVSFTTYYGEDFGYAIAQGLAAGAPTLVTEWGGGVDFVRNGGAAGIPVRLRRGTPQVDLKSAVARLEAALEPRAQKELRERARRFTASTLSYPAMERKWKLLLERTEILTQSFIPAQFATRFLKQKRLLSSQNTNLFSSERDPMLQRIYRAYLGKSQ